MAAKQRGCIGIGASILTSAPACAHAPSRAQPLPPPPFALGEPGISARWPVAGGLPESVLAPRLQQIVDELPEDGAKCAAIVQELPEPQCSTFRWLLHLFRDIAQNEDQNRMTIKSMSVVFAPTLVDPPQGMPPMVLAHLGQGRL